MSRQLTQGKRDNMGCSKTQRLFLCRCSKILAKGGGKHYTLPWKWSQFPFWYRTIFWTPISVVHNTEGVLCSCIFQLTTLTDACFGVMTLEMLKWFSLVHCGCRIASTYRWLSSWWSPWDDYNHLRGGEGANMSVFIICRWMRSSDRFLQSRYGFPNWEFPWRKKNVENKNQNRVEILAKEKKNFLAGSNQIQVAIHISTTGKICAITSTQNHCWD